MKCFITDCKDAPLLGTIVFFHKRDIALSARNCADEMTMQYIDIQKYDGRVLPALRDHFKKIVIPQISIYDQWGQLKENKQE